MISDKNFYELKESISKEAGIIKEINSFFSNFNSEDNEEKKMISSQISLLKNRLRKENENVSEILTDMYLTKPLPQVMNKIRNFGDESGPKNKKQKENQGFSFNSERNSEQKEREKDYYNFRKKISKNLKKKEGIEKKDKKPSRYVGLSNKFFSKFSIYLLDKGRFKALQRDLVKANMRFLPKSYLSVIFFSTFLSLIASIFIFTFFLFFNISISSPFITITSESILTLFLKVSWILFVIPLGTFIFMYFYPALERDSIEEKINQELPFATINMAAISGSLIDPTKIFSIIIITKEYPTLRKEFIKIINGVNVLGYDLITVLRNSAFNNPSKKLASLFNGLATTINSGGDLPTFFEERAKSLLFEYKLESEKDTRSAETFMDIYISVVIAAPMILMLLMIMIQISGLGIALSISAITLIMVTGVSLINVVFLTFLHLKQPKS